MTTAVLGATGHIGGNLVRALLDDGQSVRAIVHEDTAAIDGLDVVSQSGDVLSPESIRTAIDGADIVYNVVGRIRMFDDPMVERVNVEGVRNVTEACLDAGVKRLVHFSSIHALSAEPEDAVVDETRPYVDPKHPGMYDRTKAAGEQVVQEAITRGLDAVIVNPTGVVGPYDFKPSRMGSALLSMYHRTLPGLVEGGFNWVDSRDVADGAIGAAKHGDCGERYLLAGHWMSMKALSALVGDVTGVSTVQWTVPVWMARMSAPPCELFSRMLGRRPLFTSQSVRILQEHREISWEKANKAWGYNARPLRDTLVDVFDWFGKNGHLKNV